MSESEPRAAHLVGAVLENAYRIIRLIGEGGMGAVYEAVQLRLNKRVAVKVMARDLSANREALARFHREAEITSRLGHPHLVTVIDFGTAASGEPYLVMEYLDGTDLDYRIRQQGRLPLETALHITKQVASALSAAHDQGIVHRDLKPANVFLLQATGESDFVKILDFGISKMKAARTQLTNVLAVMGTPNYMAPEQATGAVDDIDPRTDEWSLACIVWEMLSGRGPFAAADVSALLYQVIHLDPQPLAKRAPNLPPGVEPVLRRALSKRMADRYPSIADFTKAFEAAALGRAVEVTRFRAGHGDPRPFRVNRRLDAHVHRHQWRLSGAEAVSRIARELPNKGWHWQRGQCRWQRSCPVPSRRRGRVSKHPGVESTWGGSLRSWADGRLARPRRTAARRCPSGRRTRKLLSWFHRATGGSPPGTTFACGCIGS